MTTLTNNTILTVLAIATSLVLNVDSADAARKCSRVVISHHDTHYCPRSLPKFGFSSRTIHGLGEEVVRVRWNGIASDLGLEPGDLIVSLNEFRLTCNGDWNRALRDAMDYHGGNIVLRVRDIHTGSIVYREVTLGGGIHPIGPITPKSRVVNRFNNRSTGPITLKSRGPQNNFRSNNNINFRSNNNFRNRSGFNNNSQERTIQQQQIESGLKNLSMMFKKKD